ncbi:MAG: tetratricopeptide repeat protein [Phycisphaerae bacterium]|nr:tetratricopeptide repeat protein [Phycisphaerae bacterium]
MSQNDSTPGAKGPPVAGARSSWRLAWRLPALVLGVTALVAGSIHAFRTAPLPDFPSAIAEAESLVDRQEYERAIDHVNTLVFPSITRGLVPEDQVRRFHLVIARSIARGQRARGLNVEANHKHAIAAYEKARAMGLVLTGDDTADVAESHLALGDFDAALEWASRIPSSLRSRKDAVNRRVILRTLAGPRDQRSRAVEMIGGMLSDPDLPVPERVWALCRQADLLIDRGLPGDAIDKLLRAMPRLPTEGHAAEMGELHLCLARAYMDTRSYPEASAQLERAAELVPPADSSRARIDLLAGRIHETRNELAESRERYQRVTSDFADSPEEMEALLGLAGVYAQRDEHAEAADTYATLVVRLVNGAKHQAVTPAAVSGSLMSRFRERFDAEDDPTAHRYSTMAEDLFGADQAPDEVIRGQAEVNRRLARRLIGDAASGMAMLELDPATLAQARRHYRSAAKYFRIMADRTVVTDQAEYQASLWSSADCFDRSGDREESIMAFDEFSRSFPEDPRQPEAMFRLAEAYKAQGELEQASRLYRALIDEQERGGRATAGPFADASYVPLAQTYLLDNDPGNDQEALEKLLEVAGGRLGGTSTESFREAVIELGNVYFLTGRYEQGIERLREALARYPDDPRADQLRFRLAECNRLSALAVEKELGEAMPDGRRRELTAAREARLRDAAAVYEDVRRRLEMKDARRRSAMDDLMLRNAGFYVADCAFDLGQYETAIRLYDAARERYPKDPASLVALAQIVSAHLRQGDVRRAATANERARRFYASLPDESWNDPHLPMTRREWERWIDATARLAATPGDGESDRILSETRTTAGVSEPNG